MAQPSTSAQIRAVALKESVASFITRDEYVFPDVREEQILHRAEKFASYIEHGPEVDTDA